MWKKRTIYLWSRLVPIINIAARKEQDPNTLITPTPQYKGRVKKWRKYMAAEFTVTDNQTQTLGPITALKDKKGNPVPLPPGATCQWQVDNPAVFALTPSADTFSVDAAAVGPLTSPDSAPVISLTILDNTGTAVAAGTIKGNVVTSAPVSIEDVPLGPVAEQP